MSLRDHSVAIVGAGLAGLALAQALVQAGIDVQVYERDAASAPRRQGYRLTVDIHGLAALRACLPPQLFDLLMATKGDPGGYFRFTDKNLRDIFKLSFPADPDNGGQVDRQTLHTILRMGMEDRLHFEKAAVGVDDGPDGAVVHFADGTSATASIVVAADGSGSALRAAIAPGSEPVVSAFCGIYGATPRLRGGRSVVPDALAKSGVLAISDTPGRALFFTTMRFHEPPASAFARLAPGHQPPVTDDYVMWGLVFPAREEPSDAERADQPRLHDRAIELARDYHPVLQDLVTLGDSGYTLLTGFATAQRPRTWRRARATLMGDALHVMPPFGAHGGNTALRDAALLAGQLRLAAKTGAALESAFAPYQCEALQYAFKAVDSASRSMRQLDMNPVPRWVMLKVLPHFHRATVPAPA